LGPYGLFPFFALCLYGLLTFSAVGPYAWWII